MAVVRLRADELQELNYVVNMEGVMRVELGHKGKSKKRFKEIRRKLIKLGLVKTKAKHGGLIPTNKGKEYAHSVNLSGKKIND